MQLQRNIIMMVMMMTEKGLLLYIWQNDQYKKKTPPH